jgi:hypothetical protein
VCTILRPRHPSGLVRDPRPTFSFIAAKLASLDTFSSLMKVRRCSRAGARAAPAAISSSTPHAASRGEDRCSLRRTGHRLSRPAPHLGVSRSDERHAVDDRGTQSWPSGTRMCELHHAHLAPGHVREAIRACAPNFGIKPDSAVTPLRSRGGEADGETRPSAWHPQMGTQPRELCGASCHRADGALVGRSTGARNSHQALIEQRARTTYSGCLAWG